MDDESRPSGGADTMLAARPAAGEDASIVWLRDPVDDDDPPAPDKESEHLWTESGAQEFRDRWRAVQVRFVDDPAAAVRDAEALVVSATEKLAAAVKAAAVKAGAVKAGADAPGDDTEQLRLAIRRHRELLERILEL